MSEPTEWATVRDIWRAASLTEAYELYAERIAEARREGAAGVTARGEALADEWESTETIWPSVPRRLRAALRGDA